MGAVGLVTSDHNLYLKDCFGQFTDRSAAAGEWLDLAGSDRSGTPRKRGSLCLGMANPVRIQSFDNRAILTPYIVQQGINALLPQSRPEHPGPAELIAPDPHQLVSDGLILPPLQTVCTLYDPAT